jgi:hypothetical protein
MITEAPEDSVIDSSYEENPPTAAPIGSHSRENLQMEERTCHMMPCSIDYQGMAASHMYFRPVEAEGVISSTFRGRGMLAVMPLLGDASDDDPFLSAALISVQNNQLQIKAEIDRIIEWKHEHNPDALFIENGEHASRVQVAKDWSQVALAVSLVRIPTTRKSSCTLLTLC